MECMYSRDRSMEYGLFKETGMEYECSSAGVWNVSVKGQEYEM